VIILKLSQLNQNDVPISVVKSKDKDLQIASINSTFDIEKKLSGSA
jgi:hypothetical protein